MGDGWAYENEVTLTRGQGASDRDRQKITVGADSLDELDEKMDELLERFDEWAADLRAIQPEDRRRRLGDGQTDLDGVEA